MTFAATQTLCLLLVSAITSTTRAQVSCKAGKFEKGERGNVSCHFSHDVRESQSNFNVVQYSSKPGDSGNYVLLCNWQDKTPQCKVEDGYTFDQQASQSVVVDIPEVTNNMAGMYACQIVPDDGKGITTCNLVVTETTTPVITTIGEPSRTTASRILSQASNDDQSSNKGNPNLGIIAALVVFVVATVGVGTFLIVIRWKCSLKRRSELSPGEHDAWDDIICCKPFQGLRKPTQRSPSEAKAPEEEKLNQGQRDRSAVVDDVDIEENSTGSVFTATAKRKHKYPNKKGKHSPPPEQRRAAAMTPHTPPANTSVPATSSPSATTKSPPVSSHFEKPPKGNSTAAERPLMKGNPHNVDENKGFSSAPKSKGQTQSAHSIRSVPLTDVTGDHPLMFMHLS